MLFLTVEIAFFSANVAKVEHGAWLPLVIGPGVDRDAQLAPRPDDRHAEPRRTGGAVRRLPRWARLQAAAAVPSPGVAVFLCRDKDTTPLSLRADVEHTHTLPQKVVIVSVDTVSIPHVETFERCAVEVLGHGLFKVVHLTARFGYHDKLNIPGALAEARKQGLLERNLDLEHASYFVSRITITPTDDPGMRRWQKNLFIAMALNASSAIEHFGLPGDRTVIMGSQVPL